MLAFVQPQYVEMENYFIHSAFLDISDFRELFPTHALCTVFLLAGEDNCTFSQLILRCITQPDDLVGLTVYALVNSCNNPVDVTFGLRVSHLPSWQKTTKKLSKLNNLLCGESHDFVDSPHRGPTCEKNHMFHCAPGTLSRSVWFHMSHKRLIVRYHKFSNVQDRCCPIALEFGRRLGFSDVERLAKFQSDVSIRTVNSMGLRLCEILPSQVSLDIKTDPWWPNTWLAGEIRYIVIHIMSF